MDFFHHIATGFSMAWTAQHLAVALVGCLVGWMVSVLPGLGPVAGMAMLLPMLGMWGLNASMILLASVYCGSQWGASMVRVVTSPSGTTALALTAVDGHQLSRQGRAGAALTVGAVSSGVAACLALGLMALGAPLLTDLALHIGPAEYVSLMVFSLVGAVALSPGSLIKALAMIILGLLLSQVGARHATRLFEHALGVPDAFTHIHFVVLTLGLFVLGDIITLLGQPANERSGIALTLGDMRPASTEVQQARPAVWRGTLIGSLFGLLPGAGSVLASYTAYALERRLAGQSGQFGRGDVRGVAGPAAALQAGVQSSFMPLLSLGLPLNAVMALMVGTMALKGLPPGPQVMSSHPDFFWGLIAALLIIQVLLLCVHLPLLRLWMTLLNLPYRFVFPVVTVVTCLGVYALRGSVYDLYLVAGFGVMGYVFHKLHCPLPPILLGFILGPMMESHLRNLLQPAGEWRGLVTRPVSLSLLLMTLALIVFVLLPSVRRPRELAFRET